MNLLVVSEDMSCAFMLKKRLGAQNFLVDVAKNGLEVLKKIMLKPYHAIVSGIKIPDLDGVELCSILRKKFYFLPFLFVTRIGDEETKFRAFEAGADDYLVHPFHSHDLAKRIASLIHKKSLENTQKLSIQNITLNFSSREVFRDSQKIPLQKREYQILEFLMRHQNTVFTRAALLECVCGEQAHLMTLNTIDVHVLRLRRKLQHPGQSFIRTLHGVGYKVGDFQKMSN
ncbi:response regulator transcription factor [Candidatus Peregrinibacteria bacterium]|nr:response regulator transcription factor [Candidatus Peregrinibacteria bacterium]